MNTVLPFRQKEPDDPHVAGKAFCLGCKHEWVAVAPIGTTSLECPECHTDKGLLKFNCIRDGLHWTCCCDNQYFMVQANGIYCPNCGNHQHGF